MKRSRMLAPGLFSIVIIGCMQLNGASTAKDFERDTIALNAVPEAAGVTDLNGDGNPDLIVAAQALRLFEANDAGDFSAFSYVAAGDNVVDIAIGDVNADGRPDIAVANHETDYLTILVSDEAGNLTPHEQSPLHVSIDPHPHAVRLVDMNNDGALDLLTDNRDANAIHVIFGDSNGGFEKSGVDINVGGDPYRGFAVGDLNGDGRPDIVSPNEGDIGVILTGKDGYKPAPSSPLLVRAPSAVELADLNGDGALDIIAVSSPSGASVFLGDGNGGFADEADFLLDTGVGQAHKMSVGDINADTRDDVIIAGWETPAITILLGGETIIRKSVQTGRNPWALAIADLNGDSRDDIVVGAAGDRSLDILMSVSAGTEKKEF